MTSTVRFTEEMLGHVTFGEPDFARGAQPDGEPGPRHLYLSCGQCSSQSA